ncbi:CENP-B N-terminal DNA-binding domain [Popillia japonica]|uniref:CENP-B N-terminal DNA-binding domain n=1 Tax=Popillia japonica TaxID=7064 RepID=A0AAW1IAW6_POPJA
MPRKRVKKSDRSNISEFHIREAIKAVLSNRLSQYKAAQEYQVKRQTIQSQIKKLLQHKTKEELLQDWEDSGNESDDNITFPNKYTSRQVFNCRQEDELVKYIKTCSNLNYGLTYHQIRTLAYHYAKVIKDIKIPTNWDADKVADFAASEVTNRPIDEQDSSVSKSLFSATTPLPSTSTTRPSTPPPLLTEIRPYPTATLAPKKRNTQKSKSSVYTDTPELAKIQDLEEEKKRRGSVKKQNR